MRNVIVTEYQPQWIDMFETEARHLRRVFNDELLDIHHFGSTSVPGLKAKPIIDILPVVKDIQLVDQFNDEMITLGYEPMGEYGIHRRRYFRKGKDNRTHHIHVFDQTSQDDIVRHLAVRDYLRTHPLKAKEYGDLKQQLAHLHPTNMEAYINGKDQFVKDLEQKAVIWYKTKK
ncbi:GrpB family protein [Bacillus sp. PS06]|uniref:GrpB family protein n=1 Tax=Bacillus sp. PS06 TaxID=2764176 RepID=UPI00177AEFA0|nr:GrpB family protein [Bacillus sp. PS06]MBD8070581.1 GrpB family protein [Bacillus sp. PS06]